MTQLKYILSFITFFSFLSCNTSTTKIANWPETNSDIFVESTFRSYEMSGSGSGIQLHKDGSYFYTFGSCLSSGQDSGFYKIIHDTMYFKSLLESKADPSNQGHGQIKPLSGKKFLFTKNRIYYEPFRSNYKGQFDLNGFWLLEGLKTSSPEVIDSNGIDSGYAEFMKGLDPSEMGTYKHFKLYDGLRFKYNEQQKLETIEVYKNGIKIKDSIPNRVDN